MGTHAGERQVQLPDHVEDGRRMGIQAERGGKSVFGSERRAVIVVGEVRVVETGFANQFELTPHRREWLDQGKATDLHGVGISFEITNNAAIRTAGPRQMRNRLLLDTGN
jgi:hypothetical protein